MPKGTDLSGVGQIWLNDVAALMNNRPRKTLGWRTPAEALADEIAAFGSTVALEAGSQEWTGDVDNVKMTTALLDRLLPHTYAGLFSHFQDGHEHQTQLDEFPEHVGPTNLSWSFPGKEYPISRNRTSAIGGRW